MAQRAGEKSREASISGRRKWNLFMKPGFDFQRILEMRDVQPGFFMAALYFHALAAIAVSLSVLMAGAWVVQQRTGNSGWVDTVWTCSAWCLRRRPGSASSPSRCSRT